MFLCSPLQIESWLMLCVQNCTILLLVDILVSEKCTACVKNVFGGKQCVQTSMIGVNSVRCVRCIRAQPKHLVACWCHIVFQVDLLSV